MHTKPPKHSMPSGQVSPPSQLSVHSFIMSPVTSLHVMTASPVAGGGWHSVSSAQGAVHTPPTGAELENRQMKPPKQTMPSGQSPAPQSSQQSPTMSPVTSSQVTGASLPAG